MRVASPRQGAAALFYIVQKSRGVLYDTGFLPIHRVEGLTVISVGNLRAGGTGKTPFAMHLAERISRQGRKVTVLLRGYRGRLERSGGLISKGDGPLVEADEAGDEAYQMALRLRGIAVRAGADRVRQATLAQAAGAEVLVLDDGFQHRGLYRDIDILLGPPDDMIGLNISSILPAGPLREGGEAAKRADLIGGFSADWSNQPIRPDFTFDHVPTDLRQTDGPPMAIEALRGRPVHLLAGIAGPGRFLKMAKQAGFDITGTSLFEDHHAYRDGELLNVISQAKAEGAGALLTTEKDLSRLGQRRLSLPILALGISVAITSGEERLVEALERQSV